MSTKHQFRVTVNGTVGEVLEHIPASWGENAESVEERGAYAILERRTVATGDISDCHVWDGWITLGNVAFTGWTIIAELDYREPPPYVAPNNGEFVGFAD